MTAQQTCSALRYVTRPGTGLWQPRPCQACGAPQGTVAVYEGRVWHETLCAACAARHRAAHGEQLELFGEREDET